MDTERNTNPNQRMGVNARIQQVDTLSRKAGRGDSAKLVLDLLDPILEQRLGHLLDQLHQQPPSLETMLDFRAKIVTAWDLRKTLKTAVSEGASATDALKAMFEQLSLKKQQSAQSQSQPVEAK